MKLGIIGWALFVASAAATLPAHADQYFTGDVSGTYTFTDEDVYFTGYVTLTGHLSITVNNGSIYVQAISIEGNGSRGAHGAGGYYGDAPDYISFPPTNGENGGRAWNLALKTQSTGGSSPLSIIISTDIYLNGGEGGNGGSGATGECAECYLDSIELPAQSPAFAGDGGAGGDLTINAAGDIYIRGRIECNGGNGRKGGDGGGVFGPGGQCPGPKALVARPGARGGIGGAGGDISIVAQGDFLYTSSVVLLANGGRGGRGGQGGGNGATNGVGGDGGKGGSAGTVTLTGDNIGPDDQWDYSFRIESRSGLGGNGGHGGDGGEERICQNACGCNDNDGGHCVRAVGVEGGQPGTPGNIGFIQVKAGGGTISLVGLVAIARPETLAVPRAGHSGYGGDTNDADYASCTDCSGYLAYRTPRDAATGKLGGFGGIIYFEASILYIQNCELDVRGGKGSTGGNGGNGGESQGPYDYWCASANGSAGGTGGQGGGGGTIYYNVTTINGTGGVVRRCAGGGGDGGDGGCPNGIGGGAGASGWIGTIYDFASYGPSPRVMLCFNSPGAAGNTCQ